MRVLFGMAVLMTVLAGCQSTALNGFFGTDDPCTQGDLAHSVFITVAASQPKVAKYSKLERAGYYAFRAQCLDGNVSKVTLAKSLSAYIAAVDEYKKGE